MVELLLENELLLLIVVAAVGYLLGELKIGGVSLGVSAVLFAGLGIGALSPELELPEIVTRLGLVFFVYSIGLSSGSGFFASFRRKGLRDNLLVVFMLVVAMGMTLAAASLIGLGAESAAGLFAGSLTNTPTLASLLEYIRAGTGLDPNAPVVGYSIAYPMGVVGMILSIVLMRRIFRTDYDREAGELRDLGAVSRDIEVRTIAVRKDVFQHTVREILDSHGFDVVIGRWQPVGHTEVVLAGGDTRLSPGDLITFLGSTETLDSLQEVLGERAAVQLWSDRSAFDYRRVFVSSNEVAGKRLRDLNLLHRFGAVVTRVRRGDVELLPHDDMALELGDRVRVVARPDSLRAVTAFFGDSYRALSEINLLSFSLGIMAGLLIGMIPIPLPGGITFSLGFAGGPLIAGLVLGSLGRTGPVLWQLPYSGGMLLRQLGLVLFFAGVGVRSGHAFFQTLTEAGGLAIFLAGAVITCVTALATLWIGHKLLHIPMSLLIGMLAGLQTQPAVLSFAIKETRNDLPNIGYATVYPVATIAKILLAQLIISLLV